MTKVPRVPGRIYDPAIDQFGPLATPTPAQRAIARENAEQLASYLEAQQCGQQTKQARIIRELLAATREPDR